MLKRSIKVILVVGMAWGMVSCKKETTTDDSPVPSAAPTASAPVRNAAATTSGSGPIELALKMAADTTFRIRTRTEVNLAEKGLMGKTRNFWFEIDETYTCTSVDEDGTMTIKQSWDAGRGKGEVGGGRFEWDSIEGPRAVPEIAAKFKRLLGKSMETAVKPNGELVDMWDADILADAILLENGVDGRKMDEEFYRLHHLEPMMDSIWESHEMLLTPALFSYPDKSLKPGDCWSYRSKASAVSEGFELVFLTLKEVRNGKAIFDVKIGVDLGDNPMDSDAVADRKSETGINSTGRMTFDLASGMIESAELKGEIKIESDVKNKLFDQSFEQNMQGTIKLSMTRIR